MTPKSIVTTFVLISSLALAGYVNAQEPWMLPLDERTKPWDNHIERDGSYVDVYIVDTGIRYTHDEFGDRAHPFFDFQAGGNGEDCNGHGTWLAGLVAGENTGLAPNANIYSVRVLNCVGSGSYGTIIDGLEAILVGASGPSVVVIGFGGSPSTALDNQVRQLEAAGHIVVVAAGTGSGDACSASPGRVNEVITVGATSVDHSGSPMFGDVMNFSNQGTCVDLFAPGHDLRVPNNSCDTCYTVKSGTDLAAAVVAGGVANAWSKGLCHSSACKNYILYNATANRLGNVHSGSPDLFLYVGPSSPPPIVGAVIELVDPVAEGWVNDGYDASALDTYRVYATFPDNRHLVNAAGETEENIFELEITGGIFVNDSEIDSNFAPYAPFAQLRPEVKWDTFFTIGETVGTGSGGFPETDGSPGFEDQLAGITDNVYLENSGWFIPGISHPAMRAVDGRVLLAQFTVTEGAQVTGRNWMVWGLTEFTDHDSYYGYRVDFSTVSP